MREEIIKAVEASKEHLSYPPTRGIEALQQKVADLYGYPEKGEGHKILGERVSILFSSRETPAH